MKQKTNRGKKNKKRKEWDQVPIGEEFLDESEMQNLISLEVLTDYEIIKRPDGLTDIVSTSDKSKSKGNKRKAKSDDDDDDEDGENEFEQMGFEEDDGDSADKEQGDNNEDGNEIPQLVEIIPKKKQKLENKKKIKKSQNNSEEVSSTTSGWKVMESPEDEKPTENSSKNKKKDKAKTGKVKQAEWKPEDRNAKPVISKKFASCNARQPVIETSSADSLEAEVSMEDWIKIGVRDPILKALKDAGFDKPTAIQSLTLPASLMGKKDIVGAAETGSGKTLAFAIPIIHGILEGRKDNSEIKEAQLHALILTPTRELAVQIKKHFDVAAKYAKIKTVVIVGGLAAQKQERLLNWKPDVVIATPGRFWELAKEGNPHLGSLERLRFLAVDETDRMVEQGHFKELEGILGVINKDPTMQEQRQNFVFSATLAFTHEPPQRLNKGNTKFKQQQPKKVTAKEKLKQIIDMIGVRSNPKLVDITSKKGTCETLTEMQINCPANKKDFYMYYFLMKHPGRTIVFCNSINCVRRLTNLFFLLKCSQVLPLHSEMQQKMRLKNLEKFARDDKSVLIATDVAARGLDIVDIEHVVHYEIPKTAESYIHRSGRTARAFKGGLALIFVEPSEIGRLKNIFRSLDRDPDVMLPLFSVDGAVFKQLKARVEEADKVEKFEHTVRKKLADMNWMDKAKKEMDLASSEDEDYDSDDAEGRSRKNLMEAKKKLESYKQTLNKLLADNSFLIRNNIKV